MSPDFSPPRIALFTHDAYGIGHVRRCLRIIRSLAERVPEAPILLITGSPAGDLFRDLPPNADFVKIPTVVTSGAVNARPPTLGIGMAEITYLRERTIRELVTTFDPDVLLVDNFPLGSQRELLATLQALRARSTRLVLGMRDILDPPERVRTDWGRQGMYEVLDRFYDRLLVYGAREVLDIAEAFALPSRIAARVQYCGYITENVSRLRSEAEVRAELKVSEPFVLATVGGGGDGFPLLQTFLEATSVLPRMTSVVTTGQFMHSADRATLRAMATDRDDVIILDHVRDLPSYMAAASAVVAMGGYNTTAEILSVGARAVIVPRHWRSGEHENRARAAVDAEQLLRAQALSRMGLVNLVDAKQLSPQSLAEGISTALNRPKGEAAATLLNLHGDEAAADSILALARDRMRVAH